MNRSVLLVTGSDMSTVGALTEVLCTHYNVQQPHGVCTVPAFFQIPYGNWDRISIEDFVKETKRGLLCECVRDGYHYGYSPRFLDGAEIMAAMPDDIPTLKEHFMNNLGYHVAIVSTSFLGNFGECNPLVSQSPSDICRWYDSLLRKYEEEDTCDFSS